MKKIFKTRTLALILVLAMAVSLLTISASAVTNVSLTGHGSNIASIVATGADFEEIDYAVSTDMHGTVYDYYLTVRRYGRRHSTDCDVHRSSRSGQQLCHLHSWQKCPESALWCCVHPSGRSHYLYGYND